VARRFSPRARAAAGTNGFGTQTWVADRLIAALSRAGLTDVDLLAAFRALLGLVMGSAQAELAAPLAGAGRDRERVAVAARMGGLAGAEYPHMAALAQTS